MRVRRAPSTFVGFHHVHEMRPHTQEEKLTARAVRNLPWSAELWCRRLRSLERSSEEADGRWGEDTAEAEAVMRRVWKEALGSALPSPDEYVKVGKDVFKGTFWNFRSEVVQPSGTTKYV